LSSILYAFTYDRTKTEFSARLHYLWNSTNNDPFVGFGIKNSQAGQAFHVNYAASYELFKNVRLGFNGYWLQQLTDHEINGASLPNSVSAFGASVKSDYQKNFDFGQLHTFAFKTERRQ
jgi:hypothetical protein